MTEELLLTPIYLERTLPNLTRYAKVKRRRKLSEAALQGHQTRRHNLSNDPLMRGR